MDDYLFHPMFFGMHFIDFSIIRLNYGVHKLEFIPIRQATIETHRGIRRLNYMAIVTWSLETFGRLTRYRTSAAYTSTWAIDLFVSFYFEVVDWYIAYFFTCVLYEM